jgi:hypothetical protein
MSRTLHRQYTCQWQINFIFSETIVLNNDVFAVSMGDNWGLIDKKSNLVLPFELERFLRIDDYSAFVRYNGAYGVIDLAGYHIE